MTLRYLTLRGNFAQFLLDFGLWALTLLHILFKSRSGYGRGEFGDICTKWDCGYLVINSQYKIC